MDVLTDDVGSFPLPHSVTKKEFASVYPAAHSAAAEGRSLGKDSALYDKFFVPVASSLKLKIDSGLAVVNYPQHYDMHRQFLEPINKYSKEPFLIDEKYAVIPELKVVSEEASRLDGKLNLKVCVTGPIDLYLHAGFGYNVYLEVLQNLAESVNLFLKNSMLHTKHVETAVVVLDEPSLGFADLLNVSEDELVSVLEDSVRGVRARVQIHLHTMKAADIPLRAKGIDIIACEFATSPKNMSLLSKDELEKHDKFLRAGITRTDIDSIMAEQLEKGIKPKPEQLVEDREVIKARYEKVKETFSERLAFVGPDCGLGGWPSQEAAYELLKRTVEAVR